ncbi:hypothetical protein P152DRAFT_450165 [Eremomyces bilateralis CBS 781.70]|uniref:DH domain-containing protein n=1 Tax=Eremomyces bilateralis CBS 781.70 TaxID=1392243 RepID=A0A6G1G0W6_9PEZI|nr:uncharacterized protein P152DRAFT_450165 [Eremomyces bilateralis CBS 781.70]KAF1811449.1 hypothetical protein P152DRAFT_450165 [Eremomyces bilateralis CBS 781.70]
MAGGRPDNLTKPAAKTVQEKIQQWQERNGAAAVQEEAAAAERKSHRRTKTESSATNESYSTPSPGAIAQFATVETERSGTLARSSDAKKTAPKDALAEWEALKTTYSGRSRVTASVPPPSTNLDYDDKASATIPNLPTAVSTPTKRPRRKRSKTESDARSSALPARPSIIPDPHIVERSPRHSTARKSGKGHTLRPDQLDAEIAAATTPKKRVISDGHWRKQDASPAVELRVPSPEKTPGLVRKQKPVEEEKPTGIPVIPGLLDMFDVGWEKGAWIRRQPPQPEPVANSADDSDNKGWEGGWTRPGLMHEIVEKQRRLAETRGAWIRSQNGEGILPGDSIQIKKQMMMETAQLKERMKQEEKELARLAAGMGVHVPYSGDQQPPVRLPRKKMEKEKENIAEKLDLHGGSPGDPKINQWISEQADVTVERAERRKKRDSERQSSTTDPDGPPSSGRQSSKPKYREPRRGSGDGKILHDEVQTETEIPNGARSWPRKASARPDPLMEDGIRVYSADRDEGRRRKTSRQHSGSHSIQAEEFTAISSRRKSGRPERDARAEPPPNYTVPALAGVAAGAIGSRISSWLHSTPDPFTDSPKSKPSRSRRSKSGPGPSQASTLDEETIVTETSISDDRRRQRRTSQDEATEVTATTYLTGTSQSRTEITESSYLTDITRDSASTTPPSLKRSGARHSRERPKSVVASESPSQDSRSSVDPTTLDLSEPSRGRPHSFGFGPFKRLFPSTGKRLSTIVSEDTKAREDPDSDSEAPNEVEMPAPKVKSIAETTIDDAASGPPKQLQLVPTLPTIPEPEPSTVSSQFTANSSTRSRHSTKSRPKSTSLKRRLTTTTDLMSVLSLPEQPTTTPQNAPQPLSIPSTTLPKKSSSIISARSLRSTTTTLTLPSLLATLRTDELKYLRELRTLVDGVIPVLLQCVLSKSDTALAAGLFARTTATDASNVDVTKPIVDMGVALERLKSVHRRCPVDDAADERRVLDWARAAERVYRLYIGCWKMGFRDVVVCLAAGDEKSTATKDGQSASAAWDEGMPRNADGYVVNEVGERVDVAFLLKRPLVRLKYLSKTLRQLAQACPSAEADDMAGRYAELVTAARARAADERARLEDEAAAGIDAGRARDPRSLAPVSGVSIDPSRCVAARDYFEMHLAHSSGQTVDCRVELLLRDEAVGSPLGAEGNSGDVLLCEIDETGRWLFFPPILKSRVSARLGDTKGEVLVMLRGMHSGGEEWHELMSLTAGDEQTAQDWVEMLGSSPMPPKLNRQQSFLDRQASYRKSKVDRRRNAPSGDDASSYFTGSVITESVVTGSTVTASTEYARPRTRSPSPGEVDVPIGETRQKTTTKWQRESPDPPRRSVSPVTPPSEFEEFGRKGKSPVSPLSRSPVDRNAGRSTSKCSSLPAAFKGLQPTSPVENTSPSGLRRTKATRYHRQSTASPPESRQATPERVTSTHHAAKRQNAAPPAPKHRSSEPTTAHTPRKLSKSAPKPGFSVWLPSSQVGDEEDEEMETPRARAPHDRPDMGRRMSSMPTTAMPTIPKLRKSSQQWTPRASRHQSYEDPSSAPAKLQKKAPEPVDEDLPPPPPPHRSSNILKHTIPPVELTPTNHGGRRRSSSPLKHEYQPSTASESDESLDTFSDESSILSSDSENDEDVGCNPGVLPIPLAAPEVLKSQQRESPPPSICSQQNTATLKPSDSASQGPYRSVPRQAGKSISSIASIFEWADVGSWAPLHPQECAIVISPGLIEAYDMKALHNSLNSDATDSTQPATRPLIALELTPLVPLRRGTAIDISIRSPPTSNSLLHPSSNILFRSRSPPDCEAMYHLINNARINNPTYLALQNARGPATAGGWAEAMERRNNARTDTPGTGLFGFGGSARTRSYRASTKRSRNPSISAATESSVGTMASINSALRRFSGNSKLFNLAKSSIGSRHAASLSDRSFSAEGGASGASTPPTPPGMSPHGLGAPVGLGIQDAKIRFYAAEGGGMGMGSPDQPVALRTGMEKRVVVTEKMRGERLLDVTLGEGCFERVARTGIAVSVWENVGVGGAVAATGGVAEKRVKVYMIQPYGIQLAYTIHLPMLDALGTLRVEPSVRNQNSIPNHRLCTGRRMSLIYGHAYDRPNNPGPFATVSPTLSLVGTHSSVSSGTGYFCGAFIAHSVFDYDRRQSFRTSRTSRLDNVPVALEIHAAAPTPSRSNPKPLAGRNQPIT